MSTRVDAEGMRGGGVHTGEGGYGGSVGMGLSTIGNGWLVVTVRDEGDPVSDTGRLTGF